MSYSYRSVYKGSPNNTKSYYNIHTRNSTVFRVKNEVKRIYIKAFVKGVLNPSKSVYFSVWMREHTSQYYTDVVGEVQTDAPYDL